MNTDEILQERGKTYGKFVDHAAITQSIKDALYFDQEKWCNMKCFQREALEMIAHKMGRIVNGDPDYQDSWVDIAGYAELVVKEMKGEGV